MSQLDLAPASAPPRPGASTSGFRRSHRRSNTPGARAAYARSNTAGASASHPRSNTLRVLLLAGLAFALAGCAGARAREEARTIARELREAPRPPPAPADGEAAALDERLAAAAGLEDVLRLALARNPEVLEARAAVRARLARIPAAAGLPDPELRLELKAVPLSDPLALGMAEEQMVTLGQTFPAPGSLDARAEAAAAEARAALATLREREREVIARTVAAWADLYEADRELSIRDDYRRIAGDVAGLTRGRYQAGRAAQADVLRAELAAAAVDADLVTARARRDSRAALLNALVDRPPAAPLGSPPPPEGALAAPPLEALVDAAVAARPEVRAASAGVERAEAALAGARSEARWPAFMVAGTYSRMPMGEEEHGWGAMVGVTLPWLNGRHDAEVETGEAELAAARRALDSVRNAVRYEVADARARLEAARGTLALLDEQLLPRAERAYASSRAAYAAGNGDALALLADLRALLDTRLERARAAARAAAARAELTRAAGTDLDTISEGASR